MESQIAIPFSIRQCKCASGIDILTFSILEVQWKRGVGNGPTGCPNFVHFPDLEHPDWFVVASPCGRPMAHGRAVQSYSSRTRLHPTTGEGGGVEECPSRSRIQRCSLLIASSPSLSLHRSHPSPPHARVPGCQGVGVPRVVPGPETTLWVLPCGARQLLQVGCRLCWAARGDGGALMNRCSRGEDRFPHESEEF